MKRILLFICVMISTLAVSAQQEYELLTDALTLAEGDILVIASADYQMALGPQSGDFRLGVEVTISENKLVGEGMTLLELLKSGSNWVLKTRDTGKYLYAKGSYAISETNTVSTTGTYVTFSVKDGQATVKFSRSSYQYLRFSPGPPYDFRGYDYPTSNKDIQIYRQKKDPTGINSVDNGQLTMENEPLTIVQDAPMYNSAGQRVGMNYRGIIIQNGRKIVMR